MTEEKLLEKVKKIAEQAGREILEVYHATGPVDVDWKADDSPLTEADRRADSHIVTALQELTPDIPVFSEESEAVSFELRSSWKQYWLVDPLDGTKEFINRNGEFTVNIALIREGDPLMGVVHVPVSGVSYAGLVGRFAYRQDHDSEPHMIQTSPMSKQSVRVRVVASRRHRGELLGKLLDRLGADFANVEQVSMGSSLKLCLVAEGKADLYPRLAPTSEWDTAAAQAVLHAAGGQVIDNQFNVLRYNQKNDLLNPFFFAIGDISFHWSTYLAV
ncbi:MAG: 3'(2'),5'-bisphosphate nucleotidase CysQ [Pseudohongiellaceae bacterium]